MAKLDLLAQVQRDLIESKPLADLLRSCLLLGGESGSEALRTWARRELNGYGVDDDLPRYREVPAILQRDGISGNWHYTGQEIPLSIFPDSVRETGLVDRVKLRAGVGELEALTVDSAMDGKLRLSFGGAQELAQMLDRGKPFEQTTGIYWALAPATMVGVVDKIRTSLAEFLAELGAVMPDEQELPTAEQATHALTVAISGGSPQLNIAAPSTTITASGSASVQGVTGGQTGAAGHDLTQTAAYNVSVNEAVRAWLNEYRAALPEVNEALRPIVAEHLDQVAAEIEKPEPQEVVVNTLMGSLREFARNAVSSLEPTQAPSRSLKSSRTGRFIDLSGAGQAVLILLQMSASDRRHDPTLCRHADQRHSRMLVSGASSAATAGELTSRR